MPKGQTCFCMLGAGIDDLAREGPDSFPECSLLLKTADQNGVQCQKANPWKDLEPQITKKCFLMKEYT